MYTYIWKRSKSSLNDLRRWLQENDKEVIAVDQPNQNRGKIIVKCGEQNCKFEVKTFHHNYNEDDHETPVVISSPLQLV